MKFVAHYEIKSAVSVYEDNKWFTIEHPKGLFRARIRNIPRKDFSSPFLLTLHLSFEAENLESAREACDEWLADCLNILALTTGCSFMKHRIRQIVDNSNDSNLKTLLMWGDNIDYDDPQPIFDERFATSLEKLLAFDLPAPIRRAMRWYRLGINALMPDDQFQFFWFALELVANYNKSTDKVSDQCPQCKSPLFCESCNTYPQHKPYIKQAIQALIKSIVKDCDDAIIKMLGDTRNALMHGGTLREIEEKLPHPHEEVVDLLGRIVFEILINQFPMKILKDGIIIGRPSTYVHQTISGIANVTTVVPKDDEGEVDLSFSGVKMEMQPEAPPQSALPKQITMTKEQFKRLERLAYIDGEQKDMCARIFRRTKEHEDKVYALVFSTDFEKIKTAIKKDESGEWQNLFKEVIGKIN